VLFNSIYKRYSNTIWNYWKRNRKKLSNKDFGVGTAQNCKAELSLMMVNVFESRTLNLLNASYFGVYPTDWLGLHMLLHIRPNECISCALYKRRGSNLELESLDCRFYKSPVAPTNRLLWLQVYDDRLTCWDSERTKMQLASEMRTQRPLLGSEPNPE